MPDLQRILDMLDEATMAKKFGLDHDRARESYRLEKLTVSSIEEFRREIGRYYNHHYASAIVKPRDGSMPFPEKEAAGLADGIVRKAFGSDGTIQGAYAIASSGVKGGMRAIIDAICKAFRQDQEKKYVGHVWRTEIDPLDYQGRAELMEQYLRRYGSYMPPGERPSMGLLVHSQKEIIKAHVEVLNELRRRRGR